MTIATDLERYLLSLMNQARADAGVHALILEQNLNQSADEHSQWMLDTGTFSHTGENGSRGIDRMDAAGFDFGTAWRWAENIGAEPIRNAGDFYDEVDTIFLGWMNSPPHRASMLNPNLDFVGLGIEFGILPPESGVNVPGIMATQNFASSNGVHDLDILGSAGADTLRGNTGDDHIGGGDGNDLILSAGGHDRVVGGNGNDSVNSGSGDDTLTGEAGNDFLRGAAGNDSLLGDAGNDYLIGDAGFDVLQGGAGQDSLSGGDGDDILSGGTGFDVLQGGAGNDTLGGGDQADNLYASLGDDSLSGGAGFDRLFGDFGNDTLAGGDGPDALFGMSGHDIIYGQNGNDRNYGAGGNDLIIDGAGNDLLEAGAGFDTLNGGAGDDTLFGRFNADRFVFEDIAGGFGNDTIGDFAATNVFERIDFSDVAAITDLNDLLNDHVQQIGADVLITAGTNSTVLLQGVNINQLDSTDFIF